MKRLALPAVLIAATAGLTACGGDGGPTDASHDDFCKVQTSFLDDLNADTSEDEAMKKIKELADDMEETGTPENISDDARKGFELTIKAIKDLPDDADKKDFEEIEKDFSKEEKDQMKAFDEYSSKECKDEMQQQMDDMLKDMESSMPSPS